MIKRIAGLGITVLAVTAGSLALSATPAEAAGHATGKVVSKSNLRTQSGPTTAARTLGSSKPGAKIPLACKVRGTSVGGNNIWYRLAGGHKWVSARYVANVGKAPAWCGTGKSYTGRTTAAVLKHTGPNTKAAKAGTFTKGAKVNITCKVTGPSVRGNNRWYWISGTNRWVPARYVANAGAAPDTCVPGKSSPSGNHAGGITHGTVHARGGLPQHLTPSVHAPTIKLDKVANNSKVKIDCQMTGSAVAGDSHWYLLAAKSGKTDDEWVSGKYVRVNGNQPRPCKPGVHASTTAAQSGNTYQGPSTKDQVSQKLTQGQSVPARCFTTIHVPAGHDQDWVATKNSGWVRRHALTGTKNLPLCSELVRSR